MYFVAFLPLIQITEVVQQKYINLEIIGTRWKMKLGAAGGGGYNTTEAVAMVASYWNKKNHGQHVHIYPCLATDE